MADPARARKLSDRIRVIVAETLESRVKDPRLGFVTITDARVTADLHEATVFYTVMGPTLDDEPDLEAAAAALAQERHHNRLHGVTRPGLDQIRHRSKSVV